MIPPMPSPDASPTLILRADECLDHDPGEGHQENSERLRAVQDSLDKAPIAGTLTTHPRRATRAELERVHSSAHVDRIERSARKLWTQFDPDTSACEASHEAALRSAGATIEATESVVSGKSRGAFALVRPPGHHALPDAAMGFCLFNNVAVAAEHAIAELGCRRVLILDPDVHHGNGTQEIFYQRKDVLYVSSHRFPFYPGTGALDEAGHGVGLGHTVNLPLPGGMGDADFLHMYSTVVEPIVDEYEPDLILVSAGFDTWQRDPMGGMNVTEDGYAALAALFRSWAARHCGDRIAFTLEGGYDPQGVIAGVRAVLEALTLGASKEPREISDSPSMAARDIATAARRMHAESWTSLR